MRSMCVHTAREYGLPAVVGVDAITYTDEVEPRTLLVHYLRERLGKVGTVEHGKTGGTSRGASIRIVLLPKAAESGEGPIVPGGSEERDAGGKSVITHSSG